MKKFITSLLALAVAAFSATAAVAAPVVEAVRTVVVGVAEKAHQVLFNYMARSGMVLGMAEFDSRQITARAATPPVKTAPYDQGTISVLVATTPATAAWAQNDTFEIGTIPKGSRILRSGKVYHGAFTTSVVMDVGLRQTDGTVIDADGLAADLNVAAAGVKDINGGALLVGANGYITTQDVVVYATLEGANPTDDTQAEFEIHYIAPTA